MPTEVTRERIGSRLVINLSPRISHCCICGKELVDCRQGIPMYENEPVPIDWDGPWAGYDACDPCYKAYMEKRDV